MTIVNDPMINHYCKWSKQTSSKVDNFCKNVVTKGHLSQI